MHAEPGGSQFTLGFPTPPRPVSFQCLQEETEPMIEILITQPEHVVADLHKLHHCGVQRLHTAILLKEVAVPDMQRASLILNIAVRHEGQGAEDVADLLSIHALPAEIPDVAKVAAGMREVQAHVLNAVVTQAEEGEHFQQELNGLTSDVGHPGKLEEAGQKIDIVGAVGVPLVGLDAVTKMDLVPCHLM